MGKRLLWLSVMAGLAFGVFKGFEAVAGPEVAERRIFGMLMAFGVIVWASSADRFSIADAFWDDLVSSYRQFIPKRRT